MLVDNVRLQIHYFGVHELFHRVKIHASPSNDFHQNKQKKKPSNPVLYLATPDVRFRAISDYLYVDVKVFRASYACLVPLDFVVRKQGAWTEGSVHMNPMQHVSSEDLSPWLVCFQFLNICTLYANDRSDLWSTRYTVRGTCGSLNA